jgi:hypothetical protein
MAWQAFRLEYLLRLGFLLLDEGADAFCALELDLAQLSLRSFNITPSTSRR